MTEKQERRRLIRCSLCGKEYGRAEKHDCPLRDKEEMAIIDGIDIGMRDCNVPVMWFGIKMLSTASFHVVGLAEAGEIIKKSGYYSFKQLNGKPCVVVCDGNLVRFQRMLDEKNK